MNETLLALSLLKSIAVGMIQDLNKYDGHADSMAHYSRYWPNMSFTEARKADSTAFFQHMKEVKIPLTNHGWIFHKNQVEAHFREME